VRRKIQARHPIRRSRKIEGHDDEPPVGAQHAAAFGQDDGDVVGADEVESEGQGDGVE